MKWRSMAFKCRGVVLISMLGILLLLSILGGYYAWRINGALRLHNLIEVDKAGAIAFTDRLWARGIQLEKTIKTCRRQLCDLEEKVQGDIGVDWIAVKYADRFDQAFPSLIESQMQQGGHQYLAVTYYDGPIEMAYFELWGLDAIERRLAYLSIEVIEVRDDRVLHGGRYHRLGVEANSIVIELDFEKDRVELPSKLFLNDEYVGDGREEQVILATALSEHAYYLYLSDGNLWSIDLEELLESRRVALTWITHFAVDDASGGGDFHFVLQKIGSMLHLYKIDESIGEVQKSAFDLHSGRRYVAHQWIDVSLSDGDEQLEILRRNEGMFAWAVMLSEQGASVRIEKFAQHLLGITLKLEGQNRCLDIRADGRVQVIDVVKSEAEKCVLDSKQAAESRFQLYRLEG